MPVSGLTIGGLSGVQARTVEQLTSKIEMSWTMDQVSQMTVEISDPTLALFRANYFQVRRDVTYQGQAFEIASVEISQGDGAGALATLECRRKGVQQMKRDKNPNAVAGMTATDYARLAATKYGLKFVGENSAVQRNIAKVSGPSNDESVWDVLQRLAGEAQFNVFESDGTLYFASQEWLLGKWANLTFPFPLDLASPFQVLAIPTCRRSDDDEMEATVEFILRRSPTTMDLRPGMTIRLSGMGEFDQQYLISEVVFTSEEPDPVGISCRTPVKKKPTK
jgi:hypothetical protein